MNTEMPKLKIPPQDAQNTDYFGAQQAFQSSNLTQDTSISKT